MKHRLLLSLCLVLALAGSAVAQMHDDDGEKAVKLAQQSKYIEAREAAEKILARDPNSYVANYVMGLVYWRGEGSLPRAHYYLEKALGAMEKHYGEHVPFTGPQRMHALVLFDLIHVAAEMDQYEEEIRLLDKFDRLYAGRHSTGMSSFYGWPLMKLGRMSEARTKIAPGLTSEDPDDRTRSLNTLGAIESLTDHPDRSYDIFLQLVNEVRSRRWEMQATFLYNAGEAALVLGKFDACEQHLLEATRYFDAHSYSNPFELLATLYLGEQRLPEALDAVKKMHQWSRNSEPELAQQSWANQQQITAEVLMAVGYSDAALDIVRRVLNRPDRRGGVSGSADQSEAGLRIFLRECLKVRREELSEELAWCKPGEWLGKIMERLAIEKEMWTAASRVAALTVDHKRLTWSLRPYAVDSRVAEWNRPVMNEILGEGVVAAEIKKLLARSDVVGPREAPYLLLMQGEGHLNRGDVRGAVASLQKALQTLPEMERLLRGRALALMGKAAERSGDMKEAIAYYQDALQRDPGVIRKLGIRLPVKIQADGTGREAASMLARSPRFHDVGSGFTINLFEAGGGLEGQFISPSGAVLATVGWKGERDATDMARNFCREFHRKAFGSRIDLSQTDITSLDGSNETGETVRHQIQDMLNTEGPSNDRPRFQLPNH